MDEASGELESTGMFCADMIHAAYEANCHIVVVNVEEGAMSASLGMMLQMAPRVQTTEKQAILTRIHAILTRIHAISTPTNAIFTFILQDGDGKLQADTIERIVYQVLSVKYGHPEEELEGSEPLPVELDKILDSL